MRNANINSYVPSFDASKKIDEKIEEALRNNESNIEISKLKQSKLMTAMFNNEFNIMRGRFNLPW